MNYLVWLLAFILGVGYGSRVKKSNTLLLITAGLLLAVMLGNYPHYHIGGISTTYITSIIGIALGSWGNK